MSKLSNRGITVVILAAGVSKKMRSHDPRSSIKLNNGDTLIDDQISKIRAVYKNATIIVVTGFQDEKLHKRIKSKRVKFVKNYDFENTNSAGSLLLSINDNPNENVLFIHGDIYFNIDTLKYISNVHYSDNSCILFDTDQQIKKNKVGIIKSDFMLERMSFIHPDKWCQIAFLNMYEYKKLVGLRNEKSIGKQYTFELINTINNYEDSRFYAHSPKSMKVIEVESVKDTKSEQFENIDK